MKSGTEISLATELDEEPVMFPYLQQAKKGGTPPDEEGAGPSAQPNPTPPAAEVLSRTTGGEGAAHSHAADASASPLGSSVAPSAVDLPPDLQQAVGVQTAIASAAAAVGPSTPLPIIRPAIMRPVLAASAGTTPLTVHNQAPLAVQAVAIAATQPAASAAPAPDIMSSTLEAVRRARRMVDESYKKKREAQQEDHECIVCFGKVRRAARLQPCGHMQMCSRCCKELLAIAESKQVEPLVSGSRG